MQQHTDTDRRRPIANMTPDERFEGAYAIKNTQRGVTRNGKPFLKCLLGDKSGQAPARMWSIPDNVYLRLPANGFVFAAGQTQAYQGEIQCILEHIEPLEPSPNQLAELLPVSRFDANEMFAELTQLLGTIEHPALKALAESYLQDEPLMERFRMSPAAMALHHAHIGGLLEHTLSLCKLANTVCPIYPRANRDVVLLGLFLHDLGKTRELVYERGFDYTDRGRLVGHIVEGAIMLHDKAQTLMREKGVRLPAHALNVLQHIILSHHGVPEYGAAKEPATPEAILVSKLDDIDAKMDMALNATRPHEAPAADLGGNFTEKQWGLNGARLFKPDPCDPQGKPM